VAAQANAIALALVDHSQRPGFYLWAFMHETAQYLLPVDKPTVSLGALGDRPNPDFIPGQRKVSNITIFDRQSTD